MQFRSPAVLPFMSSACLSRLTRIFHPVIGSGSLLPSGSRYAAPTLALFSRATATTPRAALSGKTDPATRGRHKLRHLNPSPYAWRPLSTSEANVLAPSAALQTASGRDLVLSPLALVVTREYEWANILVGFEQANRYSIRAAPGGQIVGYLAEESSLGRTITRNFLRTHRPFKATVFDKDQNVIFHMRRPMYIFSTSLFVETPEGEVLGEVHMNWHMWRRRYNLYVGKNQFAYVDSGFLAVDFDMRDVDGNKLASVNKDFTGFARELFTDARQYVIRLDPSFGLEHDATLVSDASAINNEAEDHGEKIGSRERAVILATAIAIDFDYFSLHSGGHMHPAYMAMPGAGGGGGSGAPAPPPAGAGASGAGTVVGADMMSDTLSESGEAMNVESPDTSPDLGARPADTNDPFKNTGSANDGDPYQSTDFDAPSNENQPEWATFEEPDHGFSDPFPDDNAWSSGSDMGGGGAGGGGGDGDGEGASGLLESIMGIFWGED